MTREEIMAPIYALLVRAGKRTIDQVPEALREMVQDVLRE